MGNFNGSVLVGNSKEVYYYQQIGFADKEKKIPLNENHLFSTGSIGKELSTLAIMKLVEDGKLNYEDKVSKYVTSLPNWSNDITIEHMSGRRAQFLFLRVACGTDFTACMKYHIFCSLFFSET